MNYILLIYPEQFPSYSRMIIWNKCNEQFENEQARCMHELSNSYKEPTHQNSQSSENKLSWTVSSTQYRIINKVENKD